MVWIHDICSCVETTVPDKIPAIRAIVAMLGQYQHEINSHPIAFIAVFFVSTLKTSDQCVFLWALEYYNCVYWLGRCANP